MARKTTN